MERKRTYAEVLSKVVTNIAETNSNPKNTDKKKIMEANISKASCSFHAGNKIAGGENIHFAIENKMSD